MTFLNARLGVFALSFAALAALGAGCASPVDDAGAPEAVGSDDAELQVGGILLANGADITKDKRPNSLRAVVKAGNAKAKLKDSSLATCTVKKNASLSNASRTVFDLTFDYEIDSGWNGCTFEFTAPGYKSMLTGGFNVDD